MTPYLSERILTEAYNKNHLANHVFVGTTGKSEVHLPVLSKAIAGWGGGVNITKQQLSAARKILKTQSVRALVAIPEDTISDAEFSLIDKVVSMFSKALAEQESYGWAKGRGTAHNEPLGFANDPEVLANKVETADVDSLGSTAKKVLDLINDAYYDLHEDYADRAKLAMNRKTLKALAKYRESAKDPSLITREDGKIWFDKQFEIITVPSMDDIEATAEVTNPVPIVMGDFSEYEVYKRSGLGIQRLEGDEYTIEELVGLYMKSRQACGVAQSDAFVSIHTKVA
jgi:HK97 family phage major capsid protein